MTALKALLENEVHVADEGELPALDEHLAACVGPVARAEDAARYAPGEDFEPASAYGEFVFSEPDLLRVLERRNRVSRSWNIKKRPRRSRKPPAQCEID